MNLDIDPNPSFSPLNQMENDNSAAMPYDPPSESPHLFLTELSRIFSMPVEGEDTEDGPKKWHELFSSLVNAPTEAQDDPPNADLMVLSDNEVCPWLL